MKRVAKDLAQLGGYFNYMSGTITKWPVLISIVEGYNERSDLQNRLQHKHYAEISEFRKGEHTDEWWKCFCKRKYGLPILARREHEPFWANILARLEALPWEAQVEFMMGMTVTSEFTRKEAREYTDVMMMEWAQEGCMLTDPNAFDPNYYTELEKELESRGKL